MSPEAVPARKQTISTAARTRSFPRDIPRTVFFEKNPANFPPLPGSLVQRDYYTRGRPVMGVPFIGFAASEGGFASPVLRPRFILFISAHPTVLRLAAPTVRPVEWAPGDGFAASEGGFASTALRRPRFFLFISARPPILRLGEASICAPVARAPVRLRRLGGEIRFDHPPPPVILFISAHPPL